MLHHTKTFVINVWGRITSSVRCPHRFVLCTVYIHPSVLFIYRHAALMRAQGASSSNAAGSSVKGSSTAAGRPARAQNSR